MKVRRSSILYIIIVFCTLIFLISCTKASHNSIEGQDIVVVENGPGGKNTHFNVYDKDLNFKYSKKTNYSVIGTDIQSMDLNKGNVYITTQYENSPLGEKISDDLLVYSIDKQIKAKSTYTSQVFVR